MTRPLGYDVDDNAIRFSNYFHVLRELVHFTQRLDAARAELGAQVRARRPRPRRRSGADARSSAACTSCATRASTRARRRRSSRRCSTAWRAPRHAQEYLDGRLHRGEAGARPRDADPPRQPRPRRRRALAAPAHADRSSARSGTRRRARQLRRRHRHVPVAAARPSRASLRILPPLEEPLRDDFVEVTETGDPYLVARAVRERRRRTTCRSSARSSSTSSTG